MLSINDEYALCFSNFVIIGFCSSPNCWLEIISLLIAPPEVLAADLSASVADFLSKHL